MRRPLHAAARLASLASLAWITALGLTLAPATAEAAKKKPSSDETSEADRDNPADALIVDASFGYSAGVLSAITGHDPKVLYGPSFHVGAGWAFPVERSKSLAVGAFFDGTFDRASITGTGDGAGLAPRVGLYGALYGKNAHIRIGAGWARTTFADQSHAGLGLAFAVGWHIPLVDDTAGHRPAITIDFVPSWDFLNAGDERLHRWGMACLVGLSLL